jgi:hypothetical protein
MLLDCCSNSGLLLRLTHGDRHYGRITNNSREINHKKAISGLKRIGPLRDGQASTGQVYCMGDEPMATYIRVAHIRPGHPVKPRNQRSAGSFLSAGSQSKAYAIIQLETCQNGRPGISAVRDSFDNNKLPVPQTAPRTRIVITRTMEQTIPPKGYWQLQYRPVNITVSRNPFPAHVRLSVYSSQGGRASSAKS